MPRQPKLGQTKVQRGRWRFGHLASHAASAAFWTWSGGRPWRPGGRGARHSTGQFSRSAHSPL